MEKINVYLSSEEMTYLRKKAKHTGVTVAEIIRRLVDAAIEGKR
jgi:predicted DNA binding CopG/RHH family protein